ncbi:MAG: PLP-dependent aminotransferase family protein [Chloroflexi bacterium]|nr:PLP-dependent aminotransferase family protein [Chloroflexota bacterium]
MTQSNTFQFQQLFARHSADMPSWGANKRGKYDFAIAYPDPASLPLTDLLASLQTALHEEGQNLALYLPSAGYLPLREFLAAKLARDRNIQVTADDLVLTAGAGQALHMVIETLIDPGDVVLTEDFTYSGTLYQMRRFRANVRGVACDHEGLLPDALEAMIKKVKAEGRQPKLIYVVPTFQNPKGGTMSLERRKALLAFAQKYNLPILEDDCYVDLRYDGQDLPSLRALDDTGLVIYVGSFSKTIAPGMRLGYMTASRELLARALPAKSGGAVNLFAAFAVHRYAVNHLASHIEEITDIQRAKRDAMVAGLETHFAGAATWTKPEGGLSLWVTLPAGIDVAALRPKILEIYDVGYSPGNNFAPDSISGKNCLRLSFGYNTPAEIQEGMGRLAEALRCEGGLA